MAPGVSLGRAPVCCAAVENFVNDRHLKALQRKVSQSKTSIKNNWTQEEERRLQTSKRNVKREQVQGDRFASIERENMRLLVKMQEIEHRGPAKAAAQAMLGKPPPGCARGGSLPPVGTGSKSGARNRELRRIDEDNQRLLRRLQGAKSSVCLPKLEEQHQARQKVMRMRCEIQKPEWKEQYPAPKILPQLFPGRLQQPPSPGAFEEQIDAECERLLALQEQLRSKADLQDALSEFAALPEAAQEGTSSPSNGQVQSPMSDAGGLDGFDEGMLGGRIPASSQAIVDSLLAEDAAARGNFAGQLGESTAEAQDSEEAANAAKDAAQNALLMARALDTGGDGGWLGYGDVVSRLRH